MHPGSLPFIHQQFRVSSRDEIFTVLADLESNLNVVFVP
jgi:hypothetical protein